MNNTQKDNYEELDQYDYLDGEYIEKVADRYNLLIGQFLIDFSYLEHEINLAIAEIIHDDFAETGYVIIEKLQVHDKIELLYKMYVRFESFKDKKNKDILDKIQQQLKSVNTFRNNIVHANWQSLSRDGFVRTKIIVDNDEGFVKFKKVQITPKIIREKIKEIRKLIEQLDEYKEIVLLF